MARKNTDTVEAPEVEITETDTVEVAETSIEEELDLSTFEASVAEALEAKDPSTGSIPEANVAKVREEYQALRGAKPKNAAKAILHNYLTEAVEAMEIAQARAVQVLIADAAVAGKAAPAPRKPVDVTKVYSEHVAALTLALYLATSEAPEGVDLKAATEAGQELANTLFPEATEARGGAETDNKLIRAAVKLATTKVKSPRERTGTQRSIEKHIREAFASLPVGAFLTKAEIKNFKSEEYGDNPPSSGAISNRVNPKGGSGTSIEGFETAERDGRIGLVKVAD